MALKRHSSPDKVAWLLKIDFVIEIYVVGTQKSRLNETVLLNTPIICLN